MNLAQMGKVYNKPINQLHAVSIDLGQQTESKEIARSKYTNVTDTRQTTYHSITAL